MNHWRGLPTPSLILNSQQFHSKVGWLSGFQQSFCSWKLPQYFNESVDMINGNEVGLTCNGFYWLMAKVLMWELTRKPSVSNSPAKARFMTTLRWFENTRRITTRNDVPSIKFWQKENLSNSQLTFFIFFDPMKQNIPCNSRQEMNPSEWIFWIWVYYDNVLMTSFKSTLMFNK